MLTSLRMRLPIRIIRKTSGAMIAGYEPITCRKGIGFLLEPWESLENTSYRRNGIWNLMGVGHDAWLPCPPSAQLLSFAKDRSDVISERDLDGLTLSCNEGEGFDHNAAVEEDTSGVILSSEDPVVDTGLEVGDVPTSSVSDDEVDSTNVPPAKRLVKPVIRLSYDKPGKSRDQPLVIVHRGMRIYITRETEEDLNIVSSALRCSSSPSSKMRLCEFAT
ncbi:hypothetical protein XENOCAPTIV_020006 [Xenoophorus captivus]|uniref:Uncharacterized protein n=1 Tax=Xenoophorus captivus TaxID=1517983 RepID=A0ABV0QKD4_9TELE